ncbi:MAG TPA: GcrA family cell cycle regulator [Caulobacteraceae bacterium]|nr:GcrA family cell cycle regulator [Caulobacteraceae bacterium]
MWTPEQERRAVRLYLVEGFTAADVADALGPGFSRAAVIGKMRRLGCLKREVRATPSASCAARPDRIPRRTAAAARPTLRLPPQRPPQPLPPLREIGPTGAPAPLACLPAGACRWPIDDPGAGRMHLTLFCGGPALAGAYCAAHRALSARRPA